ncbi:hypothetical protein EJ110_NYTH23220 [Nymphaea thermarum]|nr:hypothetical protein EJ110_NYTH23220 [Nymphaea thermarum]
MEFLDYKVSPSVSAVSKEKDSQMEAMVRDENEMVSQMEGVTADARDHLFGQVYVRKEKATVEDVEGYLSPSLPMSSKLLDDFLAKHGSKANACEIVGVRVVFSAVPVSRVTSVVVSSTPAVIVPNAAAAVQHSRLIPKIDDALATGSNTKSENLPVHVTSIRLNKDNYLSWSAALEIGITSRGRLHYITGEKPAPSKTDSQWATWALEDSQVNVWIISSVSADIQPLILRKSTAYDMWIVLARMYGRKKRVLRAYQIKRSIYALKQDDLSVASFYAALKTKWEELDYHVNDD